MTVERYEPTEQEIADGVSSMKEAMKNSGLEMDDPEITKVVKKALIKKGKSESVAVSEPTQEAIPMTAVAEPAPVDLIIETEQPKGRILKRNEYPGGNGNGKGNGKWKKHSPEPEKLKPTTFAVGIHARAVMPQDDSVQFIDPLAAFLPVKGLQQDKKILDAMSRNMKKPLPPLGYIMIIGIIGMLFIVVIYDAVIKDYIDASQDYEIRKALNNLTAGEQPPKLFDFRNLPIPGVNNGP